jgi:hypothetical protein
MTAEASPDAFDIVRAYFERGEHGGKEGAEEAVLLESMAELRARIRKARSLSSRLASVSLSPHVLHAARHGGAR